MATFGNKSSTQLSTLDRDIQTILNEAIKVFDFSIIEGQRTAERQHHHWQKGRKLLSEGLDPKMRDNWKVTDDSKVVTTKDGYQKKSIHQHTPKSEAVDIVPFPEMWSSRDKFFQLSGVIKATQIRLFAEGRIESVLDWGPDMWNDFDHPHYQLRKIT